MDGNESQNMPGLIDLPCLKTWDRNSYSASGIGDCGTKIRQGACGCLVLPLTSFARGPFLDPQFDKLRLVNSQALAAPSEQTTSIGVNEVWVAVIKESQHGCCPELMVPQGIGEDLVGQTAPRLEREKTGQAFC